LIKKNFIKKIKMKGGEKMDGEKIIPTGVKIIAVLNYIGAGLLALFGLLAIVGGGMFASVINEIPLLGVLGGGIFIVVGIILIALAVLLFFIGRGLWKGQNWARIVEIIFAILGVIMAIVGMFSTGIASNIVSLVFNGLIGGYLLFNTKVKEAFA